MTRNARTGELPEGVIWPRFENGEPVMFGDRIAGVEGAVDGIHFYEDGVDITTDRLVVCSLEKDEKVQRPEPTESHDTQDRLEADCLLDPCRYFNDGKGPSVCYRCPLGKDADEVYYPDCERAQKRDLLERQRKILGGD